MATLSFRIVVQDPDDSGNVNVLPVLLVGRKAVADVTIFGLDLSELVRSRAAGGEHFILRCWCRVPECARVDRGIAESSCLRFIPLQPDWLARSATMPWHEVTSVQARVSPTVESCAAQQRYQCFRWLHPSR